MPSYVEVDVYFAWRCLYLRLPVKQWGFLSGTIKENMTAEVLPGGAT